MFDKIGRVAEKAALGVSRRVFLGRLGRGAAVVSAALGGVVLTATSARAGVGTCCLSNGSDPDYLYCSKGGCGKKGNKGFLTVRCSDYPDICPQ